MKSFTYKGKVVRPMNLYGLPIPVKIQDKFLKFKISFLIQKLKDYSSKHQERGCN